jgi:exonuclease SbcD
VTRVIGIGDAHFGPNERNADRYAALDQIIDYGLSLPDLGAWLFAGDLNHSKMSIEDRNGLASRIQRMASASPVVLLEGNHDAPGDLEIFGRLGAEFPISVATCPYVWHVKAATGLDLAVFTLPYAHRAGLVGSGVAHDDLIAAAREAFEPIFLQGAADLERFRSFGYFPLMLAHLAIGGALTSPGQPAIGREIELDPALLARVGDVPKLFGHIHRHQPVHGAWYLGSICRLDFGEQEAKVFGVLTIDDDDRTWSLDFPTLDVPRQIHVDGRLRRDGFAIEAIDGEPYSGPLASGFTGADVKVTYRFTKAEASVLDVGAIHAAIDGARSVKLDPIAVLEHEVRAPDIAAAATLEQKVEKYCGRHGLAYSKGLQRKLTALQAYDGAVVLTNLQEQLGKTSAAETMPAEAAVA